MPEQSVIVWDLENLEAAVGIVDQSHEINGLCEVRLIPSETGK
jgi:hypothetical protein